MPMPGIEPSEQTRLWSMPEAWRDGLRLTWSIMVGGFVVFALWRISSQIFGWMRRMFTNMPGAEFEAIEGGFRTDFLNLLRRILLRIFGVRLPSWLAGKFHRGSIELTSVRQLYRHVLGWAAERGYPRQASQTPYEYSRAMLPLVCEAGEDLDYITERYVIDRYSGSKIGGEDIGRLKHSWHRLRKIHLKRKEDELENA